MKIALFIILLSISSLSFGHTGTLSMNYSLGQQTYSMIPGGQLSVYGLMGNQQVNVTVNNEGAVSMPNSTFMQYFTMIRMPSFGPGGVRYTPMFINPSYYHVRASSSLLNLSSPLQDGCHNYSVTGFIQMQFSLNGASVQVQAQTPGMGTNIQSMTVLGGTRIGQTNTVSVRVCRN